MQDTGGNASGNVLRFPWHMPAVLRPDHAFLLASRGEKFRRVTDVGTPPGASAGRPPRNLLVLITHEEEHMVNRILAGLDREWAELDASPAARAALARWSEDEPALAGFACLGDILAERKANPAVATAILAGRRQRVQVLAEEAPYDLRRRRSLLHAAGLDLSRPVIESSPL